MNISERSRSRTPGVLGTTGPASLLYFVHTDNLIELFGFDFEEPYKSVQELYENAFRCRLLDMA